MRLVLLTIFIALSTSVAAFDCPKTIGVNTAFLDPWPRARTWHGSELLATVLPDDGILPTTAPGHRIAFKLFWYSSEFTAADETRLRDNNYMGFTARIRRLDPGPDDAVLSGPNWAGQGNLGDNWTLLYGIDFKRPGCWEITGSFQDQSLTFVVQTVDNAAYRQRLEGRHD